MAEQYKANVYGASPIHGDDDVAVGAITIFEPMPHEDSEEALRQTYEHDAGEIMKVLTACLPQGTIDQLLIQLLRDRASLLRTVAPQSRWIPEPTTWMTFTRYLTPARIILHTHCITRRRIVAC